jgi:hypothetical protein
VGKHGEGRQGAVEKVHFNRKDRQDAAKNAKLKHLYSAFCDICVFSWRALRLPAGKQG